MNSRAEIVAAIQKASSLAEQAELVSQLDAYDKNQVHAAAEARSLDLTDTIVRDTMTPVRVHEMHTASTDWLGNFEAAADSENQLLATAALWYGRTTPELRADPEEFMEQAKGIMRREASAYGERAAAAYSAGMEYLAFLHRREAASGLPQIDQTVAPDGVTSQPTPIPPDVFDNFAPEVNMDNQGVVGTETSERNPLLQQIQAEDGGQGQPEWGHGTWDESWNRTPNPNAPGEEATADIVGDPEYNQFQASVALSHLFNMDEFREMQAKEAASTLDQVQQTTAPDGVTERPTPLPGDVMFPWTLPGEQNPQAEDDVSDAQAAIDKAQDGSAGGGLVRGDKQAALDDLGGKCPSCDSPVSGTGKVKCGDCGLNFERQEKQQTGKEYRVGSRRADPNGGRVVKEADMFGNSDAPHAVPQPNVANNPATTPHPEDSAASGKEDASIGNASTTADGRVYPNYSEGYSEGIESLHENDQHSVPSAMGGDNGTGLGNPKGAAKAQSAYPLECYSCGKMGDDSNMMGPRGRKCPDCGSEEVWHPDAQKNWSKKAAYDSSKGFDDYEPHAFKSDGNRTEACKVCGFGRGAHQKQSSLTPKTSALFVTVAAAQNRDFKRAYAYAVQWEEGTPLVKQGSPEFEAGLYAGISDNPVNQSAWVRAHRKWANKGQQDLATRIQLHAAFTRRVASKKDIEANGPYLVAEAATTTDLDTLDPSASPSTDGSTPINGIGQPGPLDGKQDAAAPGGASPYNGAEPFGQAAVPTGRPSASTDPADMLINDIPGGPLDGNARAYAFRRQVQANLLAASQQS